MKIFMLRHALFIILFCSCSLVTNLGKKKVVIFRESLKFTDKKSCWLSDDLCVFKLPILDQDKKYDIVLIITYNRDYIFHNIHIEYSLTKDSELVLKGQKNYNLFDEVSGFPLGSSSFLSKGFSVNIILLDDYKPTSSKSHTLTVKHFMRIMSLKGIETLTVEISTNAE